VDCRKSTHSRLSLHARVRPLWVRRPTGCDERDGREAAGPTDRGAMTARSPRPDPGRPAPGVAVGSNPAVQAKRPGYRCFGLADDLQSDPRPWLYTRSPMESGDSILPRNRYTSQHQDNSAIWGAGVPDFLARRVYQPAKALTSPALSQVGGAHRVAPGTRPPVTRTTYMGEVIRPVSPSRGCGCLLSSTPPSAA
jgi:hypothetical protein